MPYQLRTDESVQNGLRRCLREQIDHATQELTTGVNDDPVAAVHDARKALKKARSVLRLGRETLRNDQRRHLNAKLRDAGRALSSARDAEVMLQAVDDLAARFVGQLPQSTFDAIRHHLEAERDPARQRLLDSDLTREVARELESLAAGADDWTLRRGGWKALEPALLRSYRRGRRDLAVARARPTVENLHDWRKRAKDLWYHLRVLKPFAPGIIGGYADEAHALADLLGDDHDLAVLRATLEAGASALAVDVEGVIALIDRRRDQLQAKALVVGERLYAESPGAFARRMHGYWKASRRPVALAPA